MNGYHQSWTEMFCSAQDAFAFVVSMFNNVLFAEETYEMRWFSIVRFCKVWWQEGMAAGLSFKRKQPRNGVFNILKQHSLIMFDTFYLLFTRGWTDPRLNGNRPCHPCIQAWANRPHGYESLDEVCWGWQFSVLDRRSIQSMVDRWSQKCCMFYQLYPYLR